jgi:hypothetical protein
MLGLAGLLSLSDGDRFSVVTGAILLLVGIAVVVICVRGYRAAVSSPDAPPAEQEETGR